MSKCLFPTCKSHPQSNGYCVFHRIYANSTAVKVQLELPKESKKQRSIKAELKKQYPIFLAKPGNKYCKVKYEGCTKIATVVHHVVDRVGEQVFNQKDWLAVCPNCNLMVETNHAKAVKDGFKKSRITKVKKHGV